MTKAALFIDTKSLCRDWSLDITGQALSGTDSIAIGMGAHFLKARSNFFLMVTSLPEPPNAQIRLVKNLPDAAALCRREGISKLIFVAQSNQEQISLFANSPTDKLELVPWMQNTPSHEYLSAAFKSRNVPHLIAVSNRQAYEIAYHPIFSRLLVIPNHIDVEFWSDPAGPYAHYDQVVTYIGAIKPAKGFHYLSAAWPAVKAARPGASLAVCGSPGLYGKTAKLGVHGIAETDYERIILEKLGGSLASAQKLGVAFAGSVSKEQLRAQITKSAVVVVNPNTSGSVETFCVAAAEALACGIPVVGGRAGGLVEVVGHNRGGLLARNATELSDYLSRLLANPELANALRQDGREMVKQRFSKSMSIQRWDLLFDGKLLFQFTEHHPDIVPGHYKRRRFAGKTLPLPAITLLRKIKKCFAN